MGTVDEETLAVRFARCADAALFSFQVIEYQFKELNQSVDNIEKNRSEIVRALSACWGYIDSLHRLRQICRSIPGYSDRGREIRHFLSETELAEKFRHYVQHLSREVGRIPANPFPVWGSLSWIDGSDSAVTHTAMLGSMFGTPGYSGAVYDRVERRWVSKVTLAVGDQAFNFDVMQEATRRFRSHLEQVLATNLTAQLSVDKFPIATVRIAPTMLDAK